MMRWNWDAQDLWIDPERLAAAGRANKVVGTAGDDRLVGTDGRDKFDLSQGGDDTAFGKGGGDVFDFGAAFTRDDAVYGADGFDRVRIGGRYSSTIELDPAHLRNVETVRLYGAASLQYSLDVSDGFKHLNINGVQAGSLNIDASDVTSGFVRLRGGLVNDILIGGSGRDTLIGGIGGDHLTGGDGADKFVYFSKVDSENQFTRNPDTITDFTTLDAIILPQFSGGTYHIGVTATRSGDIVTDFDANVNITTLNVFLDGDDRADMTIYLVGDIRNLDVSHGNHVEVIG